MTFQDWCQSRALREQMGLPETVRLQPTACADGAVYFLVFYEEDEGKPQVRLDCSGRLVGQWVAVPPELTAAACEEIQRLNQRVEIRAAGQGGAAAWKYVAVLGQPGSAPHYWARTATMAEAVDWLNASQKQLKRVHGISKKIPTAVLTEEEALLRHDPKNGQPLYPKGCPGQPVPERV